MDDYETKMTDNRRVRASEDAKATGYILAGVGVLVVLGAIFFAGRSDTDYGYRNAPQATETPVTAPQNTTPSTTNPAP